MNDFKFSRFFDQLKIVLQLFVEYLFLSGFFTSKTIVKKHWENSEFVVSELVVGSGE